MVVFRPAPLFVAVLITAGCGAAQAIAVDPDPPPTTVPADIATEISTTTSTSIEASTTLPFEPVVLAFGGDVSLTHGLADAEPFREVAGLLAAADLAWVNLETAIAEPGIGSAPDKEYVFRSPPVTATLLASAGIDGASLANNHSLDAGIEGLERTIELLAAAEVDHAGAGMNLDQAYAPALASVGSTSIAIVSISRVLPDSSWTASASRPGLASAYHPFVDDSVEAVANASQLAEFVVVMVHWGVELAHCPEQYQLDLAEEWAAAGADLIVGSHPHVLQGVDKIGDTWVIFSTGNFAFPSAYSEDTTQAALFEVSITSEGVQLAATPLRIVEGSPTIAGVDDRQTVLGTLNARSWNVAFDSSGRAVSTPGVSTCG